MRPTSAKKRPNLQYSRKRPSTANKKKQNIDIEKDKIMNNSDQKEYYTTNENSKKKKKMVFCESAKKIAMIHAYQPKLLKQCLVTNPRKYKQFYYENSGLCMISNLYTISFMAHFKSWRKYLENQLNAILKKLLRFDPLIQIQEVNQALRELENFSEEMSSGVQVISGQQQLTLSQQAGQLRQSFQNLSKFLQKLIQILKIFCETVKKLSTTLQLALQNRMDAKQAKKQIRQSYNNFCSVCSQPAGRCQSHPDSNFMNRAEFTIKNHLKQMFEESINVLRKVKELQNFKHKLNGVSELEDKSDEQIMKVLNQTARLIKQHQGNRPRILSQESKDNKFKQISIKLDNKFNSIILDFLAKFKQKLQPILQKQFHQINDQSAQKFINQRDHQNNDRFLLCLQKFKLLSTIFNKNSSPEINQRLSQMLSRESTKTLQQLSQIIENLRDISRQGQCNSRASFFQRVNQL